MEDGRDYLEILYGDDVYDLVVDEIVKLRDKSNFTFSDEYVGFGTTFMTIKAKEILEGSRDKCTLPVLVAESFGDAGVYMFNGGIDREATE